MSPFDAAEVRLYTAAVLRARREHDREPITSKPICEACGINSATQYCITCQEKP